MSETYRANHNVSFGASRVPSHVKAGEIFELDDEHEAIAERLLASGAISLVQEEDARAETGGESEVQEEDDETKQPAEKHNKSRGAASGSRHPRR
jgi:hypothetical protein